MPKHPTTGKFISQSDYDQFVASDQRAPVLDREPTHANYESAPIDDAYRRRNDSPPRYRYDESYDHRDFAGPSRPSMLVGCLFVSMLMITLVMGGVITWLLLNQSTMPAPVTPVVTPVGNIDALVAPIKQKLAYDPAKAQIVYRTYQGLSEALASKSGERVLDTQVFAAVTEALLTDIDAGEGTPVGKEIDQAIAEYLGLQWGRDSPDTPEGYEFKSFDAADRAKLVDITAAIAKAAGEAL